MKLLMIGIFATIFLAGCSGTANTKKTSVIDGKITRAIVVLDDESDIAIDEGVGVFAGGVKEGVKKGLKGFFEKI